MIHIPFISAAAVVLVQRHRLVVEPHRMAKIPPRRYTRGTSSTWALRVARFRTTSPWRRLALPASVAVVVTGLGMAGWGLSRLHLVLLEQGTTPEQVLAFPERQPVDHPAPLEVGWIAWDASGFGRMLLAAIILHLGIKLARRRHRPKPPDENTLAETPVQTHYFRNAMRLLGLLTVAIYFLPDVYGVPRGTIHVSAALQLQDSASRASWEAEQRLKNADGSRSVVSDEGADPRKVERLRRESQAAKEHYGKTQRMVKDSVAMPRGFWVFGPEDLYGYLWDLIRVAWFGSIVAAFLGKARDMR